MVLKFLENNIERNINASNHFEVRSSCSLYQLRKNLREITQKQYKKHDIVNLLLQRRFETRSNEHRSQNRQKIAERITETLKLYHALSKQFLLIKKNICNYKKNIYIYNHNRPTLTYGSESMVTTRRMENKLQAVEIKYLTRVRGIKRAVK